MFADEADQDALDKQFLVFGAVFVPCENALSLAADISLKRQQLGFGPQDLLKFSPGNLPKHISREKHAELKSELMEMASKYAVKAACYVVFHDIAKNQSKADKLRFAANTLCANFNKFLERNDQEGGLIFFDRTTDYKQDQYFKELMGYGLPKFDGTRIPIKKILGIHSTREGLCVLHSLCDIVVGSFRFVFNEPKKDKVGKILFSQLSKLLWGEKSADGKTWYVVDAGLVLRPKKIDFAEYEADRDATIARLKSLHQT